MKKEIIVLALIKCFFTISNFLAVTMFPVMSIEINLSVSIVGTLLSFYNFASLLVTFFAKDLIAYLGRKTTFYLTINLMVKLKWLLKAVSTFIYSLFFMLGNKWLFGLSSLLCLIADGLSNTVLNILGKLFFLL